MLILFIYTFYLIKPVITGLYCRFLNQIVIMHEVA